MKNGNEIQYSMGWKGKFGFDFTIKIALFNYVFGYCLVLSMTYKANHKKGIDTNDEIIMNSNRKKRGEKCK